MKIGDVQKGLYPEVVKQMNINNSNLNDEICKKCEYQYFCGVDNIDKISRYGTTAKSTEDTFFCKNHFSIFEFLTQKIKSNTNEENKNLNLHLSGFYEPTTLFMD